MNSQAAGSAWSRTRAALRAQPRTWLVTGAAGFIGSHLVAELLALGQRVVGLDNLTTGALQNIVAVRDGAGAQGRNLRFVVGDILNPDDCRTALDWVAEGDSHKVNFVLHQAALGSVPHSIDDPLATHRVNVDGFVNVLLAARAAGVERFVYASSSAVYGDEPAQPAREGIEGAPLSPYALSKSIDEQYAQTFARIYGINTVGLRYFNIFGPRQNPKGAYAAVIPRWFEGLLRGEPCVINGDGETTRDFCFVQNVVQANLLAATTQNGAALNEVYNIALGERITLNALYDLIREQVAAHRPDIAGLQAVHAPFRTGDIRHSMADIGKAQRLLGFAPEVDVATGLRETAAAYMQASQASI